MLHVLVFVNSPDCLVEDALEVALGQRRAFQVLLRLDFFGHHHGLLILNRRHLLLPETLTCRFVIPEIKLRADKDNRNAWGMVFNFGIPLHDAVQHMCFRADVGCHVSPWP